MIYQVRHYYKRTMSDGYEWYFEVIEVLDDLEQIYVKTVNYVPKQYTYSSISSCSCSICQTEYLTPKKITIEIHATDVEVQEWEIVLEEV